MRRATLPALAGLLILSACSSRQVVVTDEPGDGPVLSRTTGGVATAPAGAKDATANPNASTAARLGIPPGHLPPPGQCRVWMPGEPPGRQKKQHPPGPCSRVDRTVPPGGWLVYRPGDDRKEVVVREYGVDRPVVVAVRVFDLVTGALLREETP